MNGANRSPDTPLPPLGPDPDRRSFSRAVQLPAAASRRVPADRERIAADGLFTPLEDLLPDLAADIDGAWRSR